MVDSFCLRNLALSTIPAVKVRGEFRHSVGSDGKVVFSGMVIRLFLNCHPAMPKAAS